MYKRGGKEIRLVVHRDSIDRVPGASLLYMRLHLQEILLYGRLNTHDNNDKHKLTK